MPKETNLRCECGSPGTVKRYGKLICQRCADCDSYKRTRTRTGRGMPDTYREFSASGMTPRR